MPDKKKDKPLTAEQKKVWEMVKDISLTEPIHTSERKPATKKKKTK